MIKVQVNDFSEKVIPTVFPDGTSQVWKLSETLVEQIKNIKEPSIVEVVWEFESESELIRVCQLSDLLYSINHKIELILNVPYLPYGRQDKPVRNDQTFAQHTFLKVISQFFSGIITIDAHSTVVLDEITANSDNLQYYSNNIPDLDIAEASISSINSKGLKELNPKIGLIYGDGMYFERFERILNRMKEQGWASTNLVIGIGGLLLQQHNRDDQGFAFKATFATIDGVNVELFKDPITDSGKRSHKGLMKLIKEDGIYRTIDQVSEEEEKTGELVTVFKDGKITKEWTLDDIRKRAQTTT